MKIYFLLLALLLINLSYSQRVIRGSGGNNGGGLGSAQSSSGDEESETIGTSIDIEGGNPFESGGDEEEPPVEEEVPLEEEPPFEEELPEEEPPVEEEVPIEEEVPEEQPVEEEETPAGAWEAWDMEEAQSSPEFMGVWDWCLGYTLEQAYQATLISGNYGNQKLVGVWRQPVNGWNYKIDCEVYDDQNNVVKMSIVGYYQQATNSRAMRNFTYGYKYYDENNWENDVSVYWKEDRGYWIDVKPVLYPEEAKHYDLDQDGYLALGGYQPMPVDEIYKDQDLYNYLVYGAQYITKYGKEQEYLNQEYPYNVKEVYSIYGQWNEDKSVKWYRYEVGLDNGYGGQSVSSYEVHWEKDFEAPEIPTLGFKRIQNQ